MFTGIIEQVATIQSITQSRFVVTHRFDQPLTLGQSVAINGMCSTVVNSKRGEFSVDIIEASKKITTFAEAQAGDLVNLERSAIIGQRNSGHPVTGHVDQVGTIIALVEKSDFWLLRIQIKKENRKFLVLKGSVALDGISLTVSVLGDDWFEVSIIPHTWENTNLKTKKMGDSLNIEFDMTGKYILNQTIDFLRNYDEKKN